MHAINYSKFKLRLQSFAILCFLGRTESERVVNNVTPTCQSVGQDIRAYRYLDRQHYINLKLACLVAVRRF